MEISGIQLHAVNARKLADAGDVFPDVLKVGLRLTGFVASG